MPVGLIEQPLYADYMRHFRRILALLTILALVAASQAVSMASVMEASAAMQVDMSGGKSSDAMGDCADCGRNAILASACAMHCMIPPAEVAAAMALIDLPMAAPTAVPVAGFTGRVPTPDLHPPRAIA
jgi:hypothetical protein